MDPAISVSHPGLADVLDPTFESGLVAAFGLVDVKCAIDAKGRTGPPDRNLPVPPHLVDKLPLAARPQSFLRAHPEAWPCPKIGLRQSASTCHFLPQADAAASSLRASGRHTSSASCRTSPR